MFDVTELMVAEDEITDVDGRRLAEILQPKVTLRRFFSGGEDGLAVVRVDGTPLLRMEKPRGERITSLWVADGDGTRIGGFKGRRRMVFSGGDHEVRLESGKVIGTARSNRMLDSMGLLDADGTELATGARRGRTWELVLRPGLSGDWTRFALAFVIATEIVRFQEQEW
jgi:hypothetical protein